MLLAKDGPAKLGVRHAPLFDLFRYERDKRAFEMCGFVGVVHVVSIQDFVSYIIRVKRP